MTDKEVVKVKHKDGYMLINKEDFNKDVHDEYKETNQDLQKMNKDVVVESLPQEEIQEEAPKAEPKLKAQPRKKVVKKDEIDSPK